MKFCVSSSSQNSSSTSAESSGVIPRRSASSSVSRCTSASGKARRISLASSSPMATSRTAALRTPSSCAVLRFCAAPYDVLLCHRRLLFLVPASFWVSARCSTDNNILRAPGPDSQTWDRRPRVNPSESSSAAGANSAPARASCAQPLARKSPAPCPVPHQAPAVADGVNAAVAPRPPASRGLCACGHGWTRAPQRRAHAKRHHHHHSQAAAPRTSSATASSPLRHACSSGKPAARRDSRRRPGPRRSACRRGSNRIPPPPAPARSDCATRPRTRFCHTAALPLAAGCIIRSLTTMAAVIRRTRPGFSTVCRTVFDTP